MKKMFLNPEKFLEFTAQYKNLNPTHIALQLNGKNPLFPTEEIITQVEGWHKAGRKLSAFLENLSFIFPDALAAEQATHQNVAFFHSTLADKYSEGKPLLVLDMTAGLGIDAITLALRGHHVTACEINQNRVLALNHNVKSLDIPNIQTIGGDSIEFINSQGCPDFDLIFIDPARRKADNQRAYLFEDCTPNIIELAPTLLTKAKNVLIKASPMLDIKKAVSQLPSVSGVFVVGIAGECKEILIELTHGYTGKPIYEALDLTAAPITLNTLRDGRDFPLMISKFLVDGNEKEGNKEGSYVSGEDLGHGYLYDPNACVHKLNASKTICNQLEGIIKISPNTDLYWSEKFFPDFPGRKLEIEKTIGKSELKQLRNLGINVATRNYPMKAAEIRAKYQLREGTDKFIYAFRATVKEKPSMVVCNKLA